MEKRAGFFISNIDIYINVVGGLELEETSIDLAVIMSVFSSLTDKFIPDDMVIFGEVGLGGEVRNVLNPDLRLREIRRLGFKKVILPKKRLEQIDTANYDLEIYGVSNVRQAINLI